MGLAAVLLVTAGAIGGPLILDLGESQDTPAAIESTDAVLSVQQASATGEAHHSCTAALVRPQWAITAAHCVTPAPPSDTAAREKHKDTNCRSVDLTQRPADPPVDSAAPMLVRGATKVYQQGGSTARVVAVHVLPGWSWGQTDGPVLDLALIRIDPPMTITPFTVSTTSPAARSRVTGAGWATWPDRCGGILNTMQQWALTVTGCEQPDFESLCTTADGKLGPCEGYSGGPLYTTGDDGTNTVIGVYSRSAAASYCGQTSARFTLLSAHQDFITDLIGP